MHWTRLSCHRFRANEVRLQLSALAYNLGNLWRRLVLLWTGGTTGPDAGSGGRKEKSQPKGSTGGNRVYTDWQSGAKMEIPVYYSLGHEHPARL
jgi:hypothetical protein